MYIFNNINFRICSSQAISKFKLDQAFALNEIVNGKFKFSKDTKETLLLHYEMWFKFILNTETLFIRSTDYTGKIDQKLLDFIKISAQETLSSLHNLMISNPNVFDTNVKVIVNKTHNIYSDYLFSELQKQLDEFTSTAFPNIVIIISNTLAELLHQLHELETLRDCQDNNCHSTIKDSNGCDTITPFVSFTQISYDVYKKLNICSLEKRLEIYHENFGFVNFDIKNYTDEPLTEEILDLIRNTDTKIINILDLNIKEK